MIETNDALLDEYEEMKYDGIEAISHYLIFLSDLVLLYAVLGC